MEAHLNEAVLTVTDHGGWTELTLNRPESMNTFNATMGEELRQAIADADAVGNPVGLILADIVDLVDVEAGAIGVHLLSGLAIVADNKRRVAVHPPTTAAVVVKTALTGVALVASAAAYREGARLGRAQEACDRDPEAAQRVRDLSARMRWLQWATPMATGGLLVLDAALGEQQRGPAGLLDRASSLRRS